MKLHSQQKCPVGKGNYSPETKSDKEKIKLELSNKSSSKSWRVRQLQSWGREGEEEAPLKGLWVLSHYRLLRRTCCERAALPGESRKAGGVVASSVFGDLSANPRAACQSRVNAPLGWPRNPALCPLNTRQCRLCWKCVAAVQTVIIKKHRRRLWWKPFIPFILPVPVGRVAAVGQCSGGLILQLTELINNVVSLCRRNPRKRRDRPARGDLGL